jgi:hypothetical protein
MVWLLSNPDCVSYKPAAKGKAHMRILFFNNFLHSQRIAAQRCGPYCYRLRDRAHSALSVSSTRP